MTTVSFFSGDEGLRGFEMRGHSGFAQAGEDIVCAALTSAARLVECAVNDVLGLEAPVTLREEEAYLSLKLPAKLPQQSEQTCQTLLQALLVYLVSLQEEYPESISVMEAVSVQDLLS